MAPVIDPVPRRPRLRHVIALVAVTVAACGVAPSGAWAAMGWVDGAPQPQANFCGGTHSSGTGQWRDSQSAAYPVPGDRYYGRIDIWVGVTCSGTDAFDAYVSLPPNTQFDFGADAGGKVRCFYYSPGTQQWSEVTNDPVAGCTQNPQQSNGWWHLGSRYLAQASQFEIQFPLKSTQVLSNSAMTGAVFSGTGGSNAMYSQVGVTVFGAPVTAINSGPSASSTTTNTSATFGFAANKQVQGFECRLDAASFTACSSQKSYTGLSDGSHTFHVRAISEGGTPATETNRSWTVDTVGPTTTITAGPSGTTSDTTPSFGFDSSEANSSFECRLDSGSYGACSSPKSYSGLADGPHTFDVRATDAVGNLGNPATRTWTQSTATVDSVPPTATPPVQSLVQNAQLASATVPVRFAWSASDNTTPAAQIKSSLQQRTNSSGTWSAYSTLLGPTLATTGTPSVTPSTTLRQFRIRAQDTAGNSGTGPAGPSFRVTAYQESNAAIAYSGAWSSTTQSGAFGGSVRYSTQVGARATLTSTGRNLAVVMPRTATGGKAQVCLDPGTTSQSCSVVDLRSSPLGARREVFVRNNLSASVTHKVRVTVQSGRVDLDAFLALR